MMISLQRALKQEQSIFEVFSSNVRISMHARLFYSDKTNSVPHWNCVYPDDLATTFKKDDIALADSMYKKMDLKGHLLFSDEKWRTKANEVSEYFVLNRNDLPKDDNANSSFSLISSYDLAQFVAVVSKVFNLDPNGKELFLKKMEIFAKRPGSQFFVIGKQNLPCATLSSFRTEDESAFLFNMAVLPEFQQLGFGSALFKQALCEIEGQILIYSHSLAMRNQILPKMGFKSIGTAYFVPIDPNDYMPDSIYREGHETS